MDTRAVQNKALALMLTVLAACGGSTATTTGDSDNVAIVEISPASVNAGQSTSLSVRISYNLATKDNGIIYLGFNTRSANTYDLDYLSTHIVAKGAGSLTLTPTVIPANWGTTSNFKAIVYLTGYPNTSGKELAVASKVITVTTTSPTATLSSISVTPAAVSLMTGSSQQFTATGHYSDNTSQNITGSATWSSSDTNKVSISTSGLATAISAGTATISASIGTVSGSALVTITATNSNPLINYFPHSVGDTWNYLYSNSSNSNSITESVTVVSSSTNSYFIKRTSSFMTGYVLENIVQMPDGAWGLALQQSCNANGVVAYQMTANPPIVQYPSTWDVGTNQTYTSFVTYGTSTTTQTFTLKITVVGFEPVTVAAGSFTALKITITDGVGTSETMWLAKGVGMVAYQVTDSSNSFYNESKLTNYTVH